MIYLFTDQTYDNSKHDKTASNNNLFLRALNYAFKKTSVNKPDLSNTTWKAKLSKYLSTSASPSLKPSNYPQNSDISDELSATYHLSRRSLLKKAPNDMDKNEATAIGASAAVNPNPCVNSQPNSNQLFLCLSSSSSASASNNSTSLSTPASFEAQNILLTGLQLFYFFFFL